MLFCLFLVRIFFLWMTVAWQWVKVCTTEKICEFQGGIELTTSIKPVRCSKHWATGTSGELRSFDWVLLHTNNIVQLALWLHQCVFHSTWHIYDRYMKCGMLLTGCMMNDLYHKSIGALSTILPSYNFLFVKWEKLLENHFLYNFDLYIWYWYMNFMY